jgi:hypothetical protein
MRRDWIGLITEGGGGDREREREGFGCFRRSALLGDSSQEGELWLQGLLQRLEGVMTVLRAMMVR